MAAVEKGPQALIVDFHTKAYPTWLQDQRDKYLSTDATFRELFSHPKTRLTSTEDLVQAMDEDGVDHSVVMGVGWTDVNLARRMNDYIIESTARHGGRLTGFASVNPGWGDDAALELERCARAGLKGLGELHPDTQGFDLDDKAAMAPVMEVVREHGLIVTAHSSEPVGHAYAGKGETRPEALWRFLQDYPDVAIVCAHWGGGLPFYALMPEVSEGLENAYFDTAASPFLYNRRVFDVGASLVGADKILLGSDFPLLRTRQLIKQVESSSLSEGDKAAITGGNASRLLGL